MPDDMTRGVNLLGKTIGNSFKILFGILVIVVALIMLALILDIAGVF